MKSFVGFPAGKVRFTSVPDLFFSELLPQIDSMPELKVTLHVIWLLYRMKGYPRCVSGEELLHDSVLLRGVKTPGQSPEQALAEGLERAVIRGTLLHVATRANDGEKQDWYFLNTEHGRHAVDRVRSGELQLAESTILEEPAVEVERPNIFVLYEQNIGTLQPMIAEELQEAEDTYPAAWIDEAFKIAVEQNVRKWSYIRAILERWATEGKDDGKAGRDSEEDRYRYIKGKYKDYVKY
ncbi:MAG: DnaD domain protein [Anaerolineae bacterium]|nr:DnaD domain protein [Anaerolineae bacterium]NIN99374.1 DnaD domain protein [Anaerolineae bacterium]NIQ82239.1 DnaD domain protein [Anaerolineae bacterium]